MAEKRRRVAVWFGGEGEEGKVREEVGCREEGKIVEEGRMEGWESVCFQRLVEMDLRTRIGRVRTGDGDGTLSDGGEDD